MKKRQTVWLVLGLSIAVAAGGYVALFGWPTSENNASSERAAEPNRADAVVGSEESADADPGRVTAIRLPERKVDDALRTTPLPPVDQPLSETFDGLLERVRRGDDRAACRLSIDLARCQRNTIMAAWGEHLEREAVRTPSDSRSQQMIEQVVTVDAVATRDAAFCGGVGAEQLEWAFPVQLAAARWRPELRLWLVSQPSLDPLIFVSELEYWQQYRAVALPWLREAALGGDATAQILMARVYGDERRNGPRIPPFREIDDAAFVTWAQVLKQRNVVYQAVESAVAEAQARLGPAATAAALAEADRILGQSASAALDEEEGRAATRQSFRAIPGEDNCE